MVLATKIRHQHVCVTPCRLHLFRPGIKPKMIAYNEQKLPAAGRIEAYCGIRGNDVLQSPAAVVRLAQICNYCQAQRVCS